MSEPLLSVCLITYNHVKYIKEAIDGVLMQKVNFSWELIIADDYSIDGTREILLEYKDKYPNFINLVLQENNKGAAKNWIDLITTPKSKYIAYLEGDDYWTDPYKLQKQVEFLESNINYIACFHNVFVLNMQNKLSLFNKLDENNYPTKVDIISKNWFIASASFMFRNNIITFPNWMSSIVNGDYAIELLLAAKGKFYYMSDVMSVYRQHDDSVSAGLLRRKIYLYRNLIELYENVKDFFEPHYQSHICNRISFFQDEIKKEQKLVKYPFLIFLDWRHYKRKLFSFLKIERVVD